MSDYVWEFGPEEDPPIWVAGKYCRTCGMRVQWAADNIPFVAIRNAAYTSCQHCNSAALTKIDGHYIDGERKESRYNKNEAALLVALKRIRERHNEREDTRRADS